MSSPVPSRKPAWDGVAPGDPVFSHAPRSAETAHRLAAEFVSRPRLVGRLDDRPGPVGHFLVAADEGDFVLHVKPTAHGQDMAVAAQVADYLASQSVPVLTYTRSHDNAVIAEGDGMVATVVPFVEARHARPTSKDAASLAKTLAMAHRALSSSPMYEATAARGRSVVDHLTEMALEIRQHGTPKCVPEEARTYVERAAHHADPGFREFGTPQPLHGDVTPGNVLFDRRGAAILIDFEDAAFSFRPTAFDVGMAALRFAHLGGQGPDQSSSSARVSAFLSAYADAGGGAWDAPRIHAAMLLVCWNTLILLTDLSRGAAVPSLGEWQKVCDWLEALRAIA